MSARGRRINKTLTDDDAAWLLRNTGEDVWLPCLLASPPSASNCGDRAVCEWKWIPPLSSRAGAVTLGSWPVSERDFVRRQKRMSARRHRGARQQQQHCVRVGGGRSLPSKQALHQSAVSRAADATVRHAGQCESGAGPVEGWSYAARRYNYTHISYTQMTHIRVRLNPPVANVPEPTSRDPLDRAGRVFSRCRRANASRM